ncbi:MAG TPA: bifunctional demethylmenaquinone methyltransferase/2-methoxy-6-polyprenyl-1,4-benzoquinol methylase UbiE [Chitinophagaceae bacterium]|jgi:ubiquinone/menaquinone biosynthesis methyltransferases
MTEKLPHDDILPYHDSLLGKKEQVAGMFDDIAPRYDFLNRFLSLGIDVGWRKKAIRQLKKDQPKLILDVATGTADMAIMACKMLQPEKITGIDISEQMLELGRKKIEKEGLSDRIELYTGDSETINFPANSFDAIMVAFGVRNFEHLDKGLKEMLRVLKPGGQVVILEFSKPKNIAIRKLYNLYMGIIAPKVAGWFCKNKDAYNYLNESAKAFPERHQLLKIMNETGYAQASFKPLSLGICCIYCGRKVNS